MSAVTMNISLTEDLKSFVDVRVKARGYSSYSEYVRDLVRKDEERAKEEQLKALIEEGLQSGSAGDWDELRVTFLADSGVTSTRHRKA
ncbi:MAG TPA: type II toxin-antitoxin system ParD family antitoxin [Ramlibacter sp.]|nr:type II toxin-antitoxin system ParD family antitoxin [Ramlibacter sp.]